MTYKEEIELLHMMDSVSEEMTDIIDFYGKDSVQVKEQKAYFRALTDVFNRFQELNRIQYE